MDNPVLGMASSGRRNARRGERRVSGPGSGSGVTTRARGERYVRT